ncbi:adenomatous polyposis coli homolog isoform X2 [Odontomachus brunneus]|uniref:adenomatous polyposis coli homolog isoform X2 n=1 Tax=Odontomachus brunneus TaxID=486640 RepID=UPI0013F24ACA|nr:adenomatous polyposis coli homolog isoform X2 [Odontomachus brunneus]
MEKEFHDRDSKVDLFYAETDLDQPTDYSLRYAEDDTDDEEKQSTEYFPGGEQEDTVKTYCTEGTPYETPFNFSTATSMSDLRVEDTKESDVLKKLPKKTIEIGRKSPVSFIKQATSLGCDERDGLVRKEEELEENSKDTAVLNPGQVTPEKVVNYYEEGTSHGFSRANSLSSLSSAMTPQNNIPGVMSKVNSPDSVNKEELESDDHSVLSLSSNQMRLPSQNSDLSANKNSRVLDKEGKMVTFGGQDYYAEETPLMFSRCSSLGSLSGFEQHSIHDDRSSVVSDFSRRTSGAVSPSELPDSPTQTVLPSPRNHKTQSTEFISKMQEEAVRPSVRHLSYSKPSIMRSSVFEDEVATFKEESTPVEFSTATSLSSLTIDDEVKIPNDTKTLCKLEKVSDTDEKNICRIEKDMLNMTINGSESKTKEEQVSDGDEDDEDMLAACINMGMQTNRFRQSFKTLNSQKPAQSEASSILVPYQRNSMPNRLESHVPVASIETSIGTSKTNKTGMEIGVVPDTVHVYCTEDTPADISPVGSQSNLSALSMPSVQEDIEKIEQEKSAEIERHRNDLSDESSNLSGEDEKILDECIQSGMSKPRQITPPPTNSIAFVKKIELPSHKFNIYGTPSSSPVETSHANKNPIMTKSLGSTSLRHPDELSDDSPNHSDDEAILTEFIQSAMPKARFSMSPSNRSPLSQTVESPKATNIRTPSTSSTYFQSGYMEQRKNIRKLLPSEDNVGLSEEEDIILAQCIRSGMPKISSSISATMTPAVKKFDTCPRTMGNFPTHLPPSYYMSKVYPARNVAQHPPSSFKPANIATTGRFVENATSSNFNCYPGKATTSMAQASSQILRNCDNNTRERINNSPYCNRRSPHHRVESENGNTVDSLCASARSPRGVKYGAPIFNRTENYGDDGNSLCRSMAKPNTVPSRHSSASSLSEEGSLISTEEWALLELCITSGMPRNKYSVKGMKPNEGAISGGRDDCEPIPEDNYSVCSYNSYVCKT